MKKLYTLLLLSIATLGFGQSIVITRVVDGTLPGDGCAGTGGSSNPKIVEMYVSGTLDLTGYRIQTESNGAADAAAISWNSGFAITDFGTQTNTFLYTVVGSGTPSTAQTFSEMYPALTGSNVIISGGAPNGNGNDAYRIVDATDVVIDQFGNPLDISGSADYSAAWAYQDSYAKRNNGVPANGGNFVNTTFTYGGVANFVAPNNTCAFVIDAIQLGQFSLSNRSFDAIAGLKIYPNPLTGSTLFVSSTANAEKNIQVYDVLGKQVINVTTANSSVNVAALTTGVYIVKVTEEGKTATRKLVVK